MLHKTLVAFAAAAALGCLPMATTALAAHSGSVGHSAHAAGRSGSGHVTAHGGGVHYARSGGGRGVGYGGDYVSGPIYDSCAGYGYSYGPGYGYNGCPGNGVPLAARVINGVLGGYGPY